MTTSAPELSGKREQNKARNRTEILAAARAVFADIGYDGYMTMEIAGGDAAYIKDVSARLDRFFAGQKPV